MPRSNIQPTIQQQYHRWVNSWVGKPCSFMGRRHTVLAAQQRVVNNSYVVMFTLEDANGVMQIAKWSEVILLDGEGAT